MPVPESRNNSVEFIVSETTLEALFLLFSYVIYRMFNVAFGWSGPAVALPLFIISASFVFISVMSLKSPSRIVRWLCRFIMYWIGCLGILFGASILFVLLRDIGPSIGIFLSPALAGETSLGLALIIFIYGTWQSQRVEIEALTLSVPNLPERWKGKQILFVSDLHLGFARHLSFAKKVARKMKSVPAEAILIGGDFFDGVHCDSRELTEPFKGLSAPLGVYFVSGNHEYFVDAEDCFSAITSVGIRVLRNEVADMDGIDLIGVDYWDTKDRKDFKNVLKKISEESGKPKFLLKHVPEDVDISEQHGISLQLSGHTHNGQIWPLSYCGYLFKGFYYGLHQLGAMAIYVSSGVGTRGAPLRIGTKSEMVVITLK